MTENISIETLYQIRVDGEEPLTVMADPDFPDFGVRVVAIGEKATDYWGYIDFKVTKQVAKALGEALIMASKGA